MKTKNTNCTISALKTIDRLLAKLRSTCYAPELDEVVRHLSAARAAGAPAPPPLTTVAGRIAEARAEIARLHRWPNGPKMIAARRRLKLGLLIVVRPLIEKGWGTPARPLAPALAKEARLTLEDARQVVNNMLRAGCLIYPVGARGPMLHEDAC
jgi:hypothetical protein